MYIPILCKQEIIQNCGQLLLSTIQRFYLWLNVDYNNSFLYCVFIHFHENNLLNGNYIK